MGGIWDFGFFEKLLIMAECYGNTFYTVSEALDANAPAGEISMPSPVTWADASEI